MHRIYNGNYKISSPFGPRRLENGDVRHHNGVDLVGLSDKTIKSICDGKVKSSQIITDKSNQTWEFGNYIIVDDGFGFYVYYCHLSKRLISVGATVKAGDVIGVEGQTGYSFGSHLHFAVRDKVTNKYIDPLKYLEILNSRIKPEEVEDTMKRYKNIKEMPIWMQEYVSRWVKEGIIKGNSDGNLDFTDDMVRCLIIAERIANKK